MDTLSSDRTEDAEADTAGAQTASEAGKRTERQVASGSFDFMDEEDVRSFVAEELGTRCLETLNIYRIKNQRVWLAITPDEILCLIDSEKTRNGNRLLQWRQPLRPRPRVKARGRSRLTTAGTVDVGDRQNWRYSIRLFPSPSDIVSSIDAMIDRARNS